MLAHDTCPVSHPGGASVTVLVLDGGAVERHCPPAAHDAPYTQQPPPRDVAHWNMEVTVQTRGQHAGMRVVVVWERVVRVLVMLHWYWVSAQGEAQVEPMWQQPAREGLVGSMMQLRGGLV